MVVPRSLCSQLVIKKFGRKRTRFSAQDPTTSHGRGVMAAVRRRLDEEVVNTVISGGIAGAVTATLVCPLDVLKTRLQVPGKGAQYNGLAAGLVRILRQEGVRGLYRGLTPTLIALIPNWAVYFTVYERLKTSLSSLYKGSTAGVHMASAAVAGAATVVVTNPLWVVKTRLITEGMGLNYNWVTKAKYRGTFNALARIWREEGGAALYSGLGPSVFGILHVVVQFPIYEYLKTSFATQNGRSVEELHPVDLVAAATISKMIASTMTYPHEVIRTQMHIKGSGPILGLVRETQYIMATDGLRGLYRGCGVNLIRTVPASALTFTCYELIARALRATLHRHTDKDESR